MDGQTTNSAEPQQAVTTAPSTFQMNAKGFFLTFPQSGARTKEEAKEALLALIPEENILWAIIALEQHKVGDDQKISFN